MALDTRTDYANLTSVASSGTSQQLLAANPNRVGVTLYNASTQTLYLLLTSSTVTGNQVASATNMTVPIATDTSWTMPFSYTGPIYGVWVSANGSALITEFATSAPQVVGLGTKLYPSGSP